MLNFQAFLHYILHVISYEIKNLHLQKNNDSVVAQTNHANQIDSTDNYKFYSKR